MPKPPPETLAWLHQAARIDGATYAQVLLMILERLELLEDGAAQPPAAQSTPLPAPAWELVERVVKVIADPDGPPELWHDEARAAIREVAAWMDERGQHGCSLWLREEADA